MIAKGKFTIQFMQAPTIETLGFMVEATDDDIETCERQAGSLLISARAEVAWAHFQDTNPQAVAKVAMEVK